MRKNGSVWRRKKIEALPADHWSCEPWGHSVEMGPITLRPLGAKEWPSFCNLVDDEIITQNGWTSEWKADIEKATDLARLGVFPSDRSLAPKLVDFVIASRSEGTVMGSISLNPLSDGSLDAAEVGYWIGPEYRRRGFATAALDAISRFGFVHLGLTRIVASTAANNAASIKVIESASFTFTGAGTVTLPNGVATAARMYERCHVHPNPIPCRRRKR